MRMFLIAAAAGALLATPAAAQNRRSADTLRGARAQIDLAAPAIDRAADALLDLDVGPLLDAARPYGPRGRHRTLREIASRDDPGFQRRMRASIYGTADGLRRTIGAVEAAEPAMRRSLYDLERAIGAAVEAVPRRLPPSDVDDDWDLDVDDEAPGDEPN